ncbi:MAG: hypothetical protein IH627_19100 [Rubrivivax sp.]|nr:hypothetical protein [Rubrivivax sp.]
MKHLARRAATIAWPAFLGAGALEMAVFAFVDPATLSLPGGEALGLSPTAVYSLAFFVFWAVVAAACALTLLLAGGADEVNAEPLADP